MGIFCLFLINAEINIRNIGIAYIFVQLFETTPLILLVTILSRNMKESFMLERFHLIWDQNDAWYNIGKHTAYIPFRNV